MLTNFLSSEVERQDFTMYVNGANKTLRGTPALGISIPPGQSKDWFRCLKIETEHYIASLPLRGFYADSAYNKKFKYFVDAVNPPLTDGSET